MNNIVAKLRDEAGYTQDVFAKMVNISRPYLSDIENNKSNPTIEIAVRIAKELKKPVDDVFFDKDVQHVEQTIA